MKQRLQRRAPPPGTLLYFNRSTIVWSSSDLDRKIMDMLPKEVFAIVLSSKNGLSLILSNAAVKGWVVPLSAAVSARVDAW